MLPQISRLAWLTTRLQAESEQAGEQIQRAVAQSSSSQQATHKQPEGVGGHEDAEGS